MYQRDPWDLGDAWVKLINTQLWKSMFVEDPCPLLLLGRGGTLLGTFRLAVVLFIRVVSSWVDRADWHHLREFTAPQAWYTAATQSVHEYRDGNTGHKLGTSPSQSHSVTRRENSTVITYLESEVTAVAGNGLGLYQCQKASCLLL